MAQNGTSWTLVTDIHVISKRVSMGMEFQWGYFKQWNAEIAEYNYNVTII
jgi:hypothetical protein